MADDLAGYLAGLVLECEGVKGKDKLKELKVDVGQDEPLTIVTNAANVEVGKRVVVATIGASLKDESKVKKAMVGGVTSEGMLCDGPMLGWQGGGAGAAALLPESFKPGEAPPRSRPRLDGGGRRRRSRRAGGQVHRSRRGLPVREEADEGGEKGCAGEEKGGARCEEGGEGWRRRGGGEKRRVAHL